MRVVACQAPDLNAKDNIDWNSKKSTDDIQNINEKNVIVYRMRKWKYLALARNRRVNTDDLMLNKKKQQNTKKNDKGKKLNTIKTIQTEKSLNEFITNK